MKIRNKASTEYQCDRWGKKDELSVAIYMYNYIHAITVYNTCMCVESTYMYYSFEKDDKEIQPKPTITTYSQKNSSLMNCDGGLKVDIVLYGGYNNI